MATDEGALRNQRIEVTRETTPGVFPADPEFMYYSDNLPSIEWSPSPGVEERRGIGSPDVATFHNGPEDHEVTVEYDLQRFPVDAEGEPLDPSGDGILRDENNDLPNTHGLLVRETNAGVPAEETVNGENSKDTRLYLVGEGGRVESVSLAGDPSSEQPVVVELGYQFEKVREYQLDQPDEPTELTLVSSETTDTFEVTLESEDGETSETVTLDGTTEVTTTEAFADLDAVDLDEDPDGDITVSEDGEDGDDLAVIRGAEFYGHGEGDEGVPALGGGERAESVEASYETILDDRITRPDEAPLAHEINSVEFAVENELETREQIGTPRMAISAGNRTVEVSATVVGPTESVQNAEQSLGAVGASLTWELSGGELVAEDARLTDFAGVSKTAGEAAMSLDNTFTGETVSASAAE